MFKEGEMQTEVSSAPLDALKPVVQGWGRGERTVQAYSRIGRMYVRWMEERAEVFKELRSRRKRNIFLVALVMM